MTRERFQIIVRFVILFSLQTFVFNRMVFFGGVVPMVYLLFLMKYPYKEDDLSLILSSFLLGFLIDVFSDTGGIFAISALLLSYFRSWILRFCFGNNIDFQKLILLHFSVGNRWLYITLMVFVHNLVFVFSEAFTLTNFLDTLSKLFFSTILSALICGMLIHLTESRR